MTTSPSKKLTPASTIPNPHRYIKLMTTDYKAWVLDGDETKAFRGLWRSDVFKVGPTTAFDVEIGIGNGFFFASHSLAHPERVVLGLELKFKPLIQSIRRAVAGGSRNVRVARFHAALVHELFNPQEINNVYIYFPDPWPKKRAYKHRLIQDGFLVELFNVMKPGSFVEFKTDNVDYYDWTLEHVQKSPFKIIRETRDLHHSQWASENFITHFEKLWTSQGLKTHLVRFEKPVDATLQQPVAPTNQT
jgi:tRNA (guanine-N7-)-methyltransferase